MATIERKSSKTGDNWKGEKRGQWGQTQLQASWNSIEEKKNPQLFIKLSITTLVVNLDLRKEKKIKWKHLEQPPNFHEFQDLNTT